MALRLPQFIMSPQLSELRCALFELAWNFIMNSVFIVDDHPVIRLAVRMLLNTKVMKSLAKLIMGRRHADGSRMHAGLSFSTSAFPSWMA